MTQDRPDEGFTHLRLARELDPMSPSLNTLEAGYLLARGRREEARIRLTRAFDIAPDFYLAHRTQGLLYLAEQQPELGIASLRRAVALADGNSRPRALLGMHLARLGQQDETRAILNDMLNAAKTRYVPPVSLAVLHAALGENALALDALERGFAVRDTQLVFLKEDSRWSSLRKEPRFAALMQKLKLADLSAPAGTAYIAHACPGTAAKPVRSCNGAQALPSWSVHSALGSWFLALVILETSRGHDSPAGSFVASDSAS
jgi:tetratricopeptide (TPR) repeat protein